MDGIPGRWEWFPAFIDRYQVAVGLIALRSELGSAEINGLIDTLPAAASRIECLTIATLLWQLALHAMPSRLLGQPPWLTVNLAQTVEAFCGTVVVEGLLVDARVSDARQYIRDHFHEPHLDLAATAAHVGISSFYLTRLIKRHTGRRFTELLREIRIDEATRALTSTTLSIKEIAARVGFSSTDDMDRNFRRQLGRPPSEIRNRL